MLVVADSSPLHYLLLIGQVKILPGLYERVVIPKTVAEELSHQGTPQLVKDFIAHPPPWLLTQSPQVLLSIDDVDEGENAAISLAVEIHADLLLIDDLDGRRAAIQHGLKITGIVGILLEASRHGLLELNTVVEQLQSSGFYLSKDLLSRLLEREE